MTIINDQDRAAVREQLNESIKRPVTLAFFVSRINCDYCDLTQELLGEVGELHDDLTLNVYDLQADAAYAAALGVDKAPAIVVLGGADATDYGLRFYGLPSGYEFASLLEAIRTVGTGEVTFQPATQAFLNELKTPMHLQVFVTPTCPHCPRAVVLAHRLAYASPHITADMVEVSEFPELGDRYGVMGVPLTVIDDKEQVEGAAPESMLLAKLRAAAQVAALN